MILNELSSLFHYRLIFDDTWLYFYIDSTMILNELSSLFYYRLIVLWYSVYYWLMLSYYNLPINHNHGTGMTDMAPKKDILSPNGTKNMGHDKICFQYVLIRRAEIYWSIIVLKFISFGTILTHFWAEIWHLCQVVECIGL